MEEKGGLEPSKRPPSFFALQQSKPIDPTDANLGKERRILVQTGGFTIGSGGLSVTGGETINNKGLKVNSGGATIAAGGLSVSGGATVSGGLSVTGVSTVKALTAGAVTASSLTSKGGLAVSGTSTVGALTAGAITASSLTSTGGLSVKGGGFLVKGGATIQDTGLLIMAGGLTVVAGGVAALSVDGSSGLVSANGVVTVTGPNSAPYALVVAKTSSSPTTGNVHIEGNLQVDGTLSYASAGDMSFAGAVTASSISSSSGLSVTGTSTMGDLSTGAVTASSLTSTGGLNVVGASSIVGGLNITGDVFISGTLTSLTPTAAPTAGFGTINRQVVTSHPACCDSVTGGFTISNDGLVVTGGVTINDSGLLVTSGGVTIAAGGLSVNGAISAGPTTVSSLLVTTDTVLSTPLLHYSLSNGIAGLVNTGTAGSTSTIIMTPSNGGVTFDTGAAFFNNVRQNGPPETNYLVANTQWTGSAMTFAYWFKTDDCSSDYYSIAGICGSSNVFANAGSVHFDLSGDSLHAYTSMSGSYGNWVVQLGNGKSLSSFGYQCGAWTHVVFTADDTTYQARMYVNGALYDSGTGTGPLPSGSYLSLGGSCDGRGFHGYLKDVRIYAKVLSAGEIVQLALSGELVVAGSATIYSGLSMPSSDALLTVGVSGSNGPILAGTMPAGGYTTGRGYTLTGNGLYLGNAYSLIATKGSTTFSTSQFVDGGVFVEYDLVVMGGAFVSGGASVTGGLTINDIGLSMPSSDALLTVGVSGSNGPILAGTMPAGGYTTGRGYTLTGNGLYLGNANSLTANKGSTPFASVSEFVEGGIFVDGDLTVTGSATISGDLTITGTVKTTAESTVPGLLTVEQGLLVTTGGLTIAAGGVFVTGNTTVTGQITSEQGLIVNKGGALINGALVVNGTVVSTQSGSYGKYCCGMYGNYIWSAVASSLIHFICLVSLTAISNLTLKNSLLI